MGTTNTATRYTLTAYEACSCGQADVHVIARRKTADGKSVQLWRDGGVTGALGFRLPGVPMKRARNAESRALNLRAGWLLLGEVCLWDLSEIGELYGACLSVAAKHGDPGDVRALMSHGRAVVLQPMWTVTHADRDGKPTERVWQLPRLRWPGLVVWDHVNHGNRGRYCVYARCTDGAYRFTGMGFRRLSDLQEYLEAC